MATANLIAYLCDTIFPVYHGLQQLEGDDLWEMMCALLWIAEWKYQMLQLTGDLL